MGYVAKNSYHEFEAETIESLADEIVNWYADGVCDNTGITKVYRVDLDGQWLDMGRDVANAVEDVVDHELAAVRANGLAWQETFRTRRE